MNPMRTVYLAGAALALVAVIRLPARGDFTPIPQPDTAYVASTDLLAITAPDFDVVAAVAYGTDTVSFDIPLVALTVPTTWSSWGSPPNTESLAPRVLWTNGLTSLSLTSTNPLTIFGLEAQPNTSVVSTISANFFSGSNLVGTITLNVDGNGGARLFGASTTTTPFNRVVLSSTDDFAIAQVRVSAVPEPTGIVLCTWATLLSLVYCGCSAGRGTRQVLFTERTSIHLFSRLMAKLNRSPVQRVITTQKRASQRPSVL